MEMNDELTWLWKHENSLLKRQELSLQKPFFSNKK